MGPELFNCPLQGATLLDNPSIVDTNGLDAFKSKKEGSFIFYQHLRKAGGTGFCDLANSNLPRMNVPDYYCMPDNRGSLATTPWNNMTYTVQQVKARKHRIIANEWDTFSAPFIQYPDVVLATTLRHPIDRWYSQYRFEHLEHRDGSKPGAPRMSFLQWYKQCVSWTMGTNYYVKTFLGEVDPSPPESRTKGLGGDFYWTYHKFNAREKMRRSMRVSAAADSPASFTPAVSWEEFSTAVEHLRRFHVVLVMEWLDSSGPLVERALGWTVPPRQVLPHEGQAARADKRSKAAREALPAADYEYLLEENAFDLLLYHIGRRLYLERLHQCSDKAV